VSVQRPWLADWCNHWQVCPSDMDNWCSNLDVQISLTGSTDVDCQDMITSFHSCRLHTVLSCIRSLTPQTYFILLLMSSAIFTVQRYASVVYAVIMYLSVCLSDTLRYCIKTANIGQIKAQYSPGKLVFRAKDYSKIRTGCR